MNIRPRELLQSGVDYLFPPKPAEGTSETARPKNVQDSLTEVGKHAVNLIHQEMKMENIPKALGVIGTLAAQSFINSLSNPYFWIGTTTLAACGFAHELKTHAKEEAIPARFSTNGLQPVALTVTTSVETHPQIHAPPSEEDLLTRQFDEIQTSRDAIATLPLYNEAINAEAFQELQPSQKNEYKKRVSEKCTQALNGIEEYITKSLPFYKLFQTLENKKKMADELVTSLVDNSSINETNLAKVTEDFNRSIQESESLLTLASSIQGGLTFAADYEKLNLPETRSFIHNISIQREMATSTADRSLLMHQKDLTAINKLLPLYKSIVALNENVNAERLTSALSELKNLKLSTIEELNESPRLKEFMTKIIREVDSHLSKLVADSIQMEIGNLTGFVNYFSSPKRAEALLAFIDIIEKKEIFNPNQGLKVNMNTLKELATKQEDWQAPHNPARLAGETSVVALACLGLHVAIKALHHSK